MQHHRFHITPNKLLNCPSLLISKLSPHASTRLPKNGTIVHQAPYTDRAVCQSKNPISSSKTPFSPRACRCTPLLGGGHAFCRLRNSSASSSACERLSSLPYTTYSCSASASASSTWWLSRSSALGTTTNGTDMRNASSTVPEPIQVISYFDRITSMRR